MTTQQHAPIWIVASLLVLIPLTYPGLFQTSTDLLPKRLFLYAGTAALCLVWLHTSLANQTHSICTPLTLAAAGYVLWNLLSLFWATNAFTGWVEALQLVVMFTLFMAVTALRLANHIQRISFVATTGGLFVSLIGIAQYLGLGFENIVSVGLPSSTFIFRNLAAAYLLGIIPLGLLALMLSENHIQKIICQFSLTAMALFLFYTRTRGAWLALVSAIVLVVILTIILRSLKNVLIKIVQDTCKWPNLRWTMIVCALLLITGIALPAKTSRQVIQQFDEQKATPAAAVQSLLTPGSDRGRFAMWRHTSTMIFDHLLIGVGLDNWEYIYPLYDHGDKITKDSEPVRPHNDLLWITSELGVIGLGLYLYMLFLFIKQAWQNLHHPQTQHLALTAFMAITALFIYSFFSFPKEQPTPSIFFWLNLGLINTHRARTKKQANLPILGLATCLCALYISIRHIAFDQQYQTARIYERRGQLQLAYQAISNALEAGTFDHRARFLKAQYLQKMGKLDASALAYQHALEAHPNYAHTHHNLGGVYAARGNFRPAIAHFQQALEMRPSYYQARLNLGNAYVATEQFDLALKTFQAVLQDNPHSAEAYTNIGAVYLRQQQFKPAIQAIREAVHLQPENAQAYNNLGYAYEQTGQITNAIQAYENLLTYWQGDTAYRETVQNHLNTLRQQLEHK